MNIAVDYMYRDESNYKFRKTIIFNNPENLTVEQIEEKTDMENVEFFYPNECHIEALDQGDSLECGYPLFHEVEEIYTTVEEATEVQTIGQFIEDFRGVN